MTIKDYFLKGIEKAGSMNKLATAIGRTGGSISFIMRDKTHADDETMLRLATYLGEDPEKLILLNQAEKAPENTRSIWQNVLKRYAGAAVILFILFPSLTAFTPLPSQASNAKGYILPDIQWGTGSEVVVKSTQDLSVRPVGF